MNRRIRGPYVRFCERNKAELDHSALSYSMFGAGPDMPANEMVENLEAGLVSFREEAGVLEG